MRNFSNEILKYHAFGSNQIGFDGGNEVGGGSIHKFLKCICERIAIIETTFLSNSFHFVIQPIPIINFFHTELNTLLVDKIYKTHPTEQVYGFGNLIDWYLGIP